MVEQLAQRTARLRPPRLFPVNGVQRLVDEEPEGGGESGPPGGDLGGGGAVEDQDQGRDDVHHQTRHCDQVGRYPQGHEGHEPVTNMSLLITIFSFLDNSLTNSNTFASKDLTKKSMTNCTDALLVFVILCHLKFVFL